MENCSHAQSLIPMESVLGLTNDFVLTNMICMHVIHAGGERKKGSTTGGESWVGCG